MFAEPADQERLLDLAELDAGVARLRHQAMTLPQHQRIKELVAARQEASDALVEATTAVSDLTEATQRAETELVPVKARLERNHTRANDGSISDPKTLNGLLDEIVHLTKRVGELEEEQLELLGQLEAAKALETRVRESGKQIVQELRETEASRNEAAEQLSSEAKKLLVQRQEIVRELPAELIGLYEKLRNAKGSGAAELRRGRCTGCQLEIPVSELDSYRKAPSKHVLRCVECDRILVRTDKSGL